jgi:hypothetical protein
VSNEPIEEEDVDGLYDLVQGLKNDKLFGA